MDEEVVNDSFPYLKELENKIGRKMPESLRMWLRDAADCDDVRRSSEESALSPGLSDSFSQKISTLRREMIWLRSADVRILRQLVAVHEGIEAMRWLMEERDALVSRSSSLTGSLSSLVGHGPPMCPFREDMSHTQGLTDEDSRDVQLLNDDSDLVTQTGPRPHHLVTFSCASSGPANASFDTIKRAPFRSSRGRRDVKVDDMFPLHQTPGEMKRSDESQDGIGNTDTAENDGAVLLGYDAQWCWVESSDDVTFL